MKKLQDEGKVRHLGLSEVSVEDIKAAQEVFEVATVQNLYNLTNRQSEDVLAYCEQQGIGFIPWFPLAPAGSPSRVVLSLRSQPHTTRLRGRWRSRGCSPAAP